jgi:S1-C subfamily serine protease
VAEKLLQTGSIAYGAIGVSGVDLDLPAQVVARHRLSQATALLVLEVEPAGSAEKAGIKEFDWILSIENRRIESLEVFLDVLDDTLIDKAVQVQILRGADFSLATKRVRVAKFAIEEES